MVSGLAWRVPASILSCCSIAKACGTVFFPENITNRSPHFSSCCLALIIIPITCVAIRLQLVWQGLSYLPARISFPTSNMPQHALLLHMYTTHTDAYTHAASLHVTFPCEIMWDDYFFPDNSSACGQVVQDIVQQLSCFLLPFFFHLIHVQT